MTIERSYGVRLLDGTWLADKLTLNDAVRLRNEDPYGRRVWYNTDANACYTPMPTAPARDR